MPFGCRDSISTATVVPEGYERPPRAPKQRPHEAPARVLYRPKGMSAEEVKAVAAASKPAITFVEGTLDLEIRGVELFERGRSPQAGRGEGRRLSEGSAAAGHRGLVGFLHRLSRPGDRERHARTSPVAAPRRCRCRVEFPTVPDFESAAYPLDGDGRSLGWSEKLRLGVTLDELPVVRVTACELAGDGGEVPAAPPRGPCSPTRPQTALGTAILRFDVMALEGRVADAAFPISPAPGHAPAARLAARLAFAASPSYHAAALRVGGTTPRASAGEAPAAVLAAFGDRERMLLQEEEPWAELESFPAAVAV